MGRYNKGFVQLARELRKNMTEEERHLWYDFLREYPVRFMRQRVIGNYIADFYCAKAHLVIEVDGMQHNVKENREYDAERTAYLNECGIQVIRIANSEVNQNFDNVCKYIDNTVQQLLVIYKEA